VRLADSLTKLGSRFGEGFSDDKDRIVEGVVCRRERGTFDAPPPVPSRQDANPARRGSRHVSRLASDERLDTALAKVDQESFHGD